MSEWYDRRGRLIRGTDAPTESVEWKAGHMAVEILLGDPDYKVVSRTVFAGTERRDWGGEYIEQGEGEVVVSTVWLGLDHGWMEGPPVIFETMVFGGRFTEDMDRYRTLAEAKAGHEVMCSRVLQAQRDDADQVIR